MQIVEGFNKEVEAQMRIDQLKEGHLKAEMELGESSGLKMEVKPSAETEMQSAKPMMETDPIKKKRSWRTMFDYQRCLLG